MKNRQLILWLSGLLFLAFAACKTTVYELWNGKDFSGWKFVLVDSTVSPADVWSVKNGVIHCAGTPNGYMRTEKEYTDFELEVEWRWPEKEGNSGVFLNAQEPDHIWPECIECQLQAGNAGDFIIIGPGTLKVGDSLYTSTETFQRIPKKGESTEKAAGEWNRYQILCTGRQITSYVNGVLQNQGFDPTLKKGYICLQSEGTPVEFRNVRIRFLKK